MKTRNDVLTVIELGKPAAVVDLFIEKYLSAKAQAALEAALAEYNALLESSVPGTDVDEEAPPFDLAAISSRMRELEEAYPQLLTGEEPSLVLDVAEGKELKRLWIKQQFAEKSKSLKAESVNGFTMDARREDIDNLRSLVEVLEAMGAPGAEIRDANNEFHTLTTGMIKALRMEMVQAGLALFQQKWQAEQELDASADWRGEL